MKKDDNHNASAGRYGGSPSLLLAAPPSYSRPKVVQRNVVWRPNQQTQELNEIARKIDQAVQSAATHVLNNPTDSQVLSVDGYTRRWGAAYNVFRTENDEDFLPATFGYAVESVACKMYFTPVRAAANELGLKVVLQATRGGSRPDIVLKDKSGKDVAWFDITSDRSVTHIDRKNSTKWLTLTDVAEITYPAFDKTKLALRSSSSSEQTHALAGAAELLVLKQKRAEKMKWLADNLPAADLTIGDTRERCKNTEKQVSALFGLTKKLAPTTTKSLLELGGKKPSDYGYTGSHKNGRNREAALELLISDDDLTISDDDISQYNDHVVSLWSELIAPTFDPDELPLFDTGLALMTNKPQAEQTVPALPLRLPTQTSPTGLPLFDASSSSTSSSSFESPPLRDEDTPEANAFVASFLS